MCLLLCLTHSQLTVNKNGLIDTEADYTPFNFSEEGRDWTGLCATYRYQSPIDISDVYSNLQIVTADNSTFREYRTTTPTMPRSELSVQNIGGLLIYWLGITTIQQEVFGRIQTFRLLEVHFMVPAEHTLNGLRYPLEAHLVYMLSLPDERIVAGFNLILLFQEGRTSPFLDDLLNANNTVVDVSPLFPPSGVVDDYYYYTGNLNMPWPDCFSPFTWIMPNYVLEASPEQIQYFNDMYINDLSFSNGRGNIRAVQPANGRPVYHYITPRDSTFLS